MIVTPLTSNISLSQPPRQTQRQLTGKVLIKAFPKGSKKDPKTFTLRNIDPLVVSSKDKLKQVIRERLPQEISQRGFDVGYLQGSNGISMRSKEDLVDVWGSIEKGTKVILWCDGLRGEVCTGSYITS